jgi:hypothetical protein
MEWGAVIFEVGFQQGNFKILQILPSILILLVFEELIFPTMSKTTEFGKKAQGFLGIKHWLFMCFWKNTQISLFFGINFFMIFV